LDLSAYCASIRGRIRCCGYNAAMTLGNSDNARKNILARIRKAQGRGGMVSGAELDAAHTYLKARPRGPLPAVEGDLLVRFRAGAESMQCTTEIVPGMDRVADAAARYLRSLQLPLSGCVSPELAGLDWTAAGLSLESRPAIDADGVGVTGCFAAIAETGTLMAVSGPATPGSISLLPETHIAVVDARRIVSHMEDGWDLLRSELGRPPRAVNFISGPSRTGDIEQTIVLGAHGPYRVHIIVVKN